MPKFLVVIGKEAEDVNPNRAFAWLVIAFGVFSLLKALGWIHLSIWRLVLTYWPAVFTLWGVKEIAGVKRARQLGRRPGAKNELAPVLAIVVGVLLIANKLGWIAHRSWSIWGVGWALLLIYVGVSLLDFRGGDQVVSTYLGDLSYGDKPFELNDTRFETMLGGIRLDLSQAMMAKDEVTLEFVSGLGGVEILVPRDLGIMVHARISLGDISIFGDEFSGLGRELSWTSPGFSTAEKRVRLFFNMKLGDVVIRHA